MAVAGKSEVDGRGLSARQLILVFLVGVAVCGVFFSLGFLVGYNERASRPTLVTTRVTAPSVIPPTVNPPAETPPSAENGPSTGTPVANAPAPSQLPTPAAAGTESKPLPAPPASHQTVQGPAAAVSTLPAQAGANVAGHPEPSSVVNPAAKNEEVGVGFTVQIAASRTKEDAEALVNILKARGYPVLLVTPEYAYANDNLFRVQVGPFTSHEDAEKVRAKLAQEGFKPFIRH
jgi:DedD protein